MAGQSWYSPSDLPDTNPRFGHWNTSASGAAAAKDFRNEQAPLLLIPEQEQRLCKLQGSDRLKCQAQTVVEAHLKEIQDAWHHHFGH